MLHKTRQTLNQAESKFLRNSRQNPTPNWRTQIKQSQLSLQASTILLQRHPKFWVSLLKPLKISSNFTPFLFNQILNRIRTQPKICFDFFNWARKNLNFKPDLSARRELTRILFGSEFSKLGKPILNSKVEDCSPEKIVALFRPYRNADFGDVSPVFNHVIECYCRDRLHFRSLEFYFMIRVYGVRLSVGVSDELLNLLVDQNEIRLAWCFYASIIRDGVSSSRITWSVIAKILYKEGKFERIYRILDLGVYTPEIFDLIIDGYSKTGDFGSVFHYLNEVCSRGIEPSFITYSSILDGARRNRNEQVTESVSSLMVKKGFISNLNSIIKNLCGLGKTFATDLFFDRACNDNIELEDTTLESMLIALLVEEGRLQDAIAFHHTLQQKKVSLSKNCYDKFVITLCQENPSSEITNLLVDIIRRGVISQPKEISTYIDKQCSERRWGEAEELLNLILDRGWLLDPHCCGTFLRRFCSTGQIDRAILLHRKLEELEGTLPTATNNMFLAALLKERRIEEAMRVFDYMKKWKTVDSESFALMIRNLCNEKEMRKAMKFHDEMLELGLKPEQRVYKRLISGFR